MRTSPLALSSALAMILSLPSLVAQSPKLMTDLNREPAVQGSSQPSAARSSNGVGGNHQHQMLVVGSYAYFTANDGRSGTELYRTQGTSGSVKLIKDILPGFLGSSPRYLQAVVVGSQTKVFFQAGDAKSGPELWVTDGSTAGTKMVKDIRAGTRGSYPQLGGSFQGLLWFSANDGRNGAELWVSDGTAAGTRMLKDIVPGAGGSQPALFTEFNGKVYFQADDGSTGVELWQSDGTAKGTILLANLRAGKQPSWPSQFTVMGKKLYFTASGDRGRELYSTDGTAKGTSIVKDIYPGVGAGVSAEAAFLAVFKNKLYLAATDGARGVELWQSDGTRAGTTLIKDVNIGGQGSDPKFLTVFGGRIYYVADDGVHGPELYSTDGTSKGTSLVADIRSGALGSEPDMLTVTARNLLLFRATGDLVGRELYRFDPRTKKTSLVKDINARTVATGSSLANLTALPTGLNIMAANDGNNTGTELWVSDGTTKGTRLLKDIWGPGPGNATRTGLFGSIEPVFGRFFFSGNNGASGRELWISDGSPSGTKIVKDIVPGEGSSWARGMTRLGNQVLFVAQDRDLDTEVWISDGTAAGTKRLKDIRPGKLGSAPMQLTRIRNKVWFTANDGTTGLEPWVSDGTAGGTRRVADIESRSASSAPRFYVGLPNGRVLFSAFQTKSGTELWISDGTQAGTKILKDIRKGAASSHPSSLVAWNGKVYFSANDGKNGVELWVSDGTAAGTKLVKDIEPGSGSSSANYFVPFKGKLWLSAFTSTQGVELWSTDGSPAGTKLALDLGPTTLGSAPWFLTAAGSRYLYLSAWVIPTQGPWSGFEVYRTDGTLSGTKLFDIRAGKRSSRPGPFTAMNGRIYFGADDGIHGEEIWFIENGAMAIPIGDVMASTGLSVTDPVLGGNMTIAGVTSVSRAFSVVGLGLADPQPSSLGSFVPGSHAYFQLTSPFLILSNQAGASFSTVIGIPNAPGLLGAKAVMQMFSLDTNAFPAKTEVSNGVHITIGR